MTHAFPPSLCIGRAGKTSLLASLLARGAPGPTGHGVGGGAVGGAHRGRGGTPPGGGGWDGGEKDAAIAGEDRLFATLDPTARRVALASPGRSAVVSDTVGFISDLPVQLVDAFRATVRLTRVPFFFSDR